MNTKATGVQLDSVYLQQPVHLTFDNRFTMCICSVKIIISPINNILERLEEFYSPS
jgi:hypothetical protein